LWKEYWKSPLGNGDGGGSVGTAMRLSCNGRLAGESYCVAKEQRRKERRTDLDPWGMLLLTAKIG